MAGWGAPPRVNPPPASRRQPHRARGHAPARRRLRPHAPPPARLRAHARGSAHVPRPWSACACTQGARLRAPERASAHALEFRHTRPALSPSLSLTRARAEGSALRPRPHSRARSAPTPTPPLASEPEAPPTAPPPAWLRASEAPPTQPCFPPARARKARGREPQSVFLRMRRRLRPHAPSSPPACACTQGARPRALSVLLRTRRSSILTHTRLSAYDARVREPGFWSCSHPRNPAGAGASHMTPAPPGLKVNFASTPLASGSPHPRSAALYQLTEQLLQKYHKEVRPVRDWTEATTVYLDISFRAVLDVDAQNQKLKTSVWYQEVWEDEFLSWNSSLYDEITEISLPLSVIWAPDIFINEYVDIERSPDLPYVYVNSSGTIKNSKPIQVVSACSLETYAFPFDVQNCSLTFNSVLHTVEDVDLAFLRSREDIKHDKKAYVNDSEWELVSVSSTYNILQSSTGNFAQIQFNVVIRRRPLVYIVNLLIPSIFLMLVDLGSFYLPPTCRTRVVFKTSVLVGYTVFRVNMADEMPRTAVSTPLIGSFFTVCMALLVFSLSESILLVRFLHDERCSGQVQPLLCLQGNPEAGRTRTDPRDRLAGEIDSPICLEHQAGNLKDIWAQLHSLGSSIRAWEQADQQRVRWLILLERFDRLLLHSYLAVLGLYAVTLGSLWALWSGF
ncbi:5-hydroxytryptamine receptor 3B [Suncus etruscus]|uniref:5-hydroxytryptamine receptor 3B n=1 Tax=Suncus etruscus TaxID=109475 RepID=UPI0021105E89|nr:5-hydroxytryptamine receptor 3B [Suncus etruscus]